MDEKTLNNNLKKQVNLTNLYAEKQATFFQQLLIVSSSILGIIVALHETRSECQCIRLVFVFSVVLFALCILGLLWVLLDHTNIVKRARLQHLDELQKAVKYNRKMKSLEGIGKKKRTLFLEKCSLFLFVAGLLSLVSYALLINCS